MSTSKDQPTVTAFLSESTVSGEPPYSLVSHAGCPEGTEAQGDAFVKSVGSRFSRMNLDEVDALSEENRKKRFAESVTAAANRCIGKGAWKVGSKDDIAFAAGVCGTVEEDSITEFLSTE